MSLFRRIVLWLAAAAVVLATWVGLAIVGASLIVPRCIPWEIIPDNRWLRSVGVLVALVAIGVPWAIKRWPRKRTLALLALLPALLLSFLAWDIPEPASADLGVRVGEEDIVYRTAMWMTPSSRFSRLREMKQESADSVLRLPEAPTAWRDYVEARRLEIEVSWQKQKIGREWIELLKEQTAKGVWLTQVSTSTKSYTLKIDPVRNVVHGILLRALALTYNNEADRGMQEVASVIQATQTLQRSAPDLLNQMVCSVMMDWSLDVAEEIVQTGTLSAGVRTQFCDILKRSPSIELLCRNSFQGTIEHATQSLKAAREKRSAIMITGVSQIDYTVSVGIALFGPLVINDHRTLADIQAVLGEAERLSVARQMEALRRLRTAPVVGWQRFKNPAGRLIGASVVERFDKVVDKMASLHDRRVALRRALDRFDRSAETPSLLREESAYFPGSDLGSTMTCVARAAGR